MRSNVDGERVLLCPSEAPGGREQVLIALSRGACKSEMFRIVLDGAMRFRKIKVEDVGAETCGAGRTGCLRIPA